MDSPLKEMMAIAAARTIRNDDIVFCGTGISMLAVMGFEDGDRRMYLRTRYPEVAVDDVIVNTGFTVDVARCQSMEPPSSEKLRVLRDICGPQRPILG